MIKRRRATPVSLLILTVILRTLIAPGYMLSTSAADGMRIVFCNGPVGLPGHHHLGDPQEGGKTDGAHHVTPTCGFWSTSSHGFISYDIPSVPFVPLTNSEVDYRLLSVHQPLTSTRGIRAPPVLS